MCTAENTVVGRRNMYCRLQQLIIIIIIIISLEQAMKAQRGSRGTALSFL
jgi:hypothetical protein